MDVPGDGVIVLLLGIAAAEADLREAAQRGRTAEVERQAVIAESLVHRQGVGCDGVLPGRGVTCPGVEGNRTMVLPPEALVTVAVPPPVDAPRVFTGVTKVWV